MKLSDLTGTKAKTKKHDIYQFMVSIDRPYKNFDELVREFEVKGFICKRAKLKTTVYIRYNFIQHEDALKEIIKILESNIEEQKKNNGVNGAASLADVIEGKVYDIYM